MKRALCLLLICLFCTGCSALPPEERAFCVVLLVDGGAQECTVRVRIPTYQQNGGYQTLSATGATLTDALRTLESAAPMRLHWGQLRLIVLSRAWAAEIPIVRTISDLSGVENLRLHASVAVTEEDTTALAEKLVPENGTRLSKSIDVMVQGVDEARVADLLLRKLESIRRDPQPFALPMAMPRTPLRHFKEEIPGLTQAKLCMLFTTGGESDPPSVSILRVAMSVLGGSATSRLFRNVREKQSLCYYCGSAAQRSTGVMMIDSGVEPGKEQQAEAAILAELEGLKNGPITQEEMDDCRRGLLSSMDALSDSLAALEGWYYGQITRGEPLYPPEYGKVLTGAVTLDEVRQALQSYSYSVCYDVTAKPGTAGKGGAEDV